MYLFYQLSDDTYMRVIQYKPLPDDLDHNGVALVDGVEIIAVLMHVTCDIYFNRRRQYGV